MEKYPLIVIGSGAGGLVCAIGFASAGRKVLLVEKGEFGGDCTNYGCIPSKAILSSAMWAHHIKEGKVYGIESESVQFNADKALERVKKIISRVRDHEDRATLESQGVDVLEGVASFDSPNTVKVTDKEGKETLVYGKQIVIAAGGHPRKPVESWGECVDYLTNETIFALKSIPKSMIFLGGGPIGCELAQAFSRLGSKVIIIHRHSSLLNKEDPKAAKIVEDQLKKEGIEILFHERIANARCEEGKVICDLESGLTIEGEKLFLGIGRDPNIEQLQLDKAGITHTEKGIGVDNYGRTNVKHVWAVGDVIGKEYFTHLAEYQARKVLTSLILPFEFKAKWKKPLVPRVTYTDPEIASVGLSEKEAKEMYKNIAVYELPFSKADRAICSGEENGFIKVITKKWSSKILGAIIVGPTAGELIVEIMVAMENNIPLRKLAKIIHPYPTYSRIVRKVADLYLKETILPLFKRKK